jgi:hypothetical protein
MRYTHQRRTSTIFAVLMVGFSFFHFWFFAFARGSWPIATLRLILFSSINTGLNVVLVSPVELTSFLVFYAHLLYLFTHFLAPIIMRFIAIAAAAAVAFVTGAQAAGT